MNKYELFPGIFANKGQTEALDLLNDFLRSDEKLFMLNGRGGTGKSTIIRKITESYPGSRYIGITVSHKAKKVLGRVIGRKRVTTVASSLVIRLNDQTGEFKPDHFLRRKKGIPLQKYDLIIVDEASMISQELFDEIIEFKKPIAKVIFLGDNSQLPPIGSNKVSPVFELPNKYTLTEKMRQAATSPIINIGELISNNYESENTVLRAITPELRVNQYDEISGSSIIFEASRKKVLDMFVEDFQSDPRNVNNVKAITFNNENHTSGQSVGNLNRIIREKLWGNDAKNQYVPGELLMSYDSFGDENDPIFSNSEDFILLGSYTQKGVLLKASAYDYQLSKTVFFEDKYDLNYLDLEDEEGNEYDEIPVIAESSKEKFKNDLSKMWNISKPLYFSMKSQVANLQYGYAITSHKSQGSTYQSCYVFEDNILGPTNASSIESKNQALYVAVSRPKKKLVIISSQNTVQTENTQSSVDSIVPKVPTFKIKKEEVITASISNQQGEILNVITDSGFTSFKQIIELLVYRSRCGKGNFLFDFSNGTESKQIKKKI